MFQEGIISNAIQLISESIKSGHFLDVETELIELKDLSTKELVAQRMDKYSNMGEFKE